MSVDTIKFVDSIASSPTVRLDVNDGTVWRCGKFDAPPPRLRRAVSQNAMRDGINVSSSQYDARVVTLELALVHSSEDNAATEIQKLARELDRADNFLMYQPTGASKPVFFRLFRSDMSQIEQFTGGANAFKRPTIELLAEPFALGLRETLGPFTVNNDPAAGSNGLYFDVTGAIGDVVAPATLWNATRTPGFGMIATRQHGTPSDLTWWTQAEATSPFGTDTTNPGGGPDAAMSGTGTNNFVRTSFATVAALTDRISWDMGGSGATLAQNVARRGRYRVFACVRRSDNTSTIAIGARVGASYIPDVTTLPLTTNRIMVDCGLVTIGNAPAAVGYGSGSNASSVGTNVLNLMARRTAGAGTLDWDFVAMIPADEAMGFFDPPVASTGWDLVIDGVSQQAWRLIDGATSAAIFTGGASNFDVGSATTVPWTGGFLSLVPNQTNRVFFWESDGTSGPMTKGNTSSIEINYWPQYLFVRPSAT